MNFFLSNILIGILVIYNIRTLNWGKKTFSPLEYAMQGSPILLVFGMELEPDEFPSNKILYVMSAVFKLCSFHQIGSYISAVLLLVIYRGEFYLLSKLRNFMCQMAPLLYSVEVPNFLDHYLYYCVKSIMHYYMFGILLIRFLRDRLPFEKQILQDVIVVLAVDMMISLAQITRITIGIQEGVITIIQMPETEDGFPRVLFRIRLFAPLFQSVRKTFGPITSKKDELRSWVEVKYLGKGQFGEVHAGFFIKTGHPSARKQIEYAENEGHIELAEKEIKIMSGLHHRNIVKYYGAIRSDRRLYIFLELMDRGSLRSVYLKNRRPFTYDEVTTYTRQILCGLYYLHQENIIHRDIKCDNILINKNGVVKLADFGLVDKIRTEHVINARSGTPRFMAPEVDRREAYDLKADIWSLGCTVIEMSIGGIPSVNPLQDLSRIPSGPNLHDFIQSCLQPDPSDRPDVADLLNHPLVNQGN